MYKRTIKDFLLTAADKADIPCRTPASLYSVFLDNGYIRDPFFGENMKRVKEGVPESCTFRTAINISEAEASYKHIYLKVGGVDLVGEIRFNDKTYAKADNSDRVYIFEITDRVKVGENELAFIGEAPIGEKRPTDLFGNTSLEYEAAPYVPDMGIYLPVQLMATNSAIITEVRVSQSHEEEKVTLMVDVDTIGSDEDVRAIATLTSPTGELYYGGVSMGHGIITVRKPHLWWPAGLGSPDLYRLTVTLYHMGEATDSYEKKIGLRHISISRDENGVPAVVVNGIKIFSKGATYIPENPIYPYIRRENTERLVKSAIRSNMNTLRVFSERNAPPDHLLELCDKHGLLVWHDIPVHYIAAPAARAYAAGITAAIRDRIARVCMHASLALIYFSVTELQGSDQALSEDSVREFREESARIIRPVVQHYGSGATFIVNREELEYYDERYLSEREIGESVATLPSLPMPASIEAFTGDRQTNLLSPELEYHTSIPGALMNMFLEMIEKFKLPKGTAQLAYASQLSAAFCLSDIIKRLRRDENSSMSAVCRQFNDAWPAVSPSFIDWYGREKAESFLAGRFYAPLTVSCERAVDKLLLYVTNEYRKDFIGKLTLAIYDNLGDCRFETTQDASVPMLTSLLIIEEDISKFDGERDLFITYHLDDHTGVVAEGVNPIALPKKYLFSAEPIKYEISGFGKSYSLKLTSSGLAKGVFVSFVGIDVELEDNFIDMTGLVPVKLGFTTSEVTTSEDLMKRIEIRTLADLGK